MTFPSRAVGVSKSHKGRGALHCAGPPASAVFSLVLRITAQWE